MSPSQLYAMTGKPLDGQMRAQPERRCFTMVLHLCSRARLETLLQSRSTCSRISRTDHSSSGSPVFSATGDTHVVRVSVRGDDDGQLSTAVNIEFNSEDEYVRSSPITTNLLPHVLEGLARPDGWWRPRFSGALHSVEPCAPSWRIWFTRPCAREMALPSPPSNHTQESRRKMK